MKIRTLVLAAAAVAASASDGSRICVLAPLETGIVCAAAIPCPRLPVLSSLATRPRYTSKDGFGKAESTA